MKPLLLTLLLLFPLNVRGDDSTSISIQVKLLRDRVQELERRERERSWAQPDSFLEDMKKFFSYKSGCNSSGVSICVYGDTNSSIVVNGQKLTLESQPPYFVKAEKAK